MTKNITLYTDGACSGNPGPGGYAAILVASDDNGRILKEKTIAGGENHTTNNRMEMRAIIEGLKALIEPTPITVVSDSQYVIFTMTKHWKRKKNHDLWQEIDRLNQEHTIEWVYVRGHDGHDYNERCDKLAVAEVKKRKKQLEE